jgi:hypothetical protein
MDQANDTATSFRFFTILEADAARTRQKTGEVQGDAGTATKPEVTVEAEKSTNGSKVERSNGSHSSSRRARSKSGDRKTEKETNEVSPKGKRKVTFDVKPDVVTIKRSPGKENKEEDSEKAGRASEGRP